MNQPATLVSGTNLNGETLTINAGQQISSLVNYKQSFGATWNDATNFNLQINYPEVSTEHEALDNLRLMQLG